jgi:hypothetical protein
MIVPGVICAIIAAILIIMWLYRKLSMGAKYVKTTGEIIDVKNMAPLVDKRQVFKGKKYVYTECKYQGDVYVAVRFINREGEELTRRHTISEPFYLKINEHKRSVSQYTSFFPEWQIRRRIKIFYDPADTLDVFVGKVSRHKKVEG